MQRLAQVAETISATSKKTEKVRLLADYFRSRTVEESAVSAIFLSGRPFPARVETTLQVGGRMLWRVVAEISGQPEHAMSAAYRRHGDLGSATFDVFSATLARNSGSASSLPRSAKACERGDLLNVLHVAKWFRELAEARGPLSKSALVRELLSRATPLEAKYLVKIITGELRIGLKESLVEEAIAAAYGYDNDGTRDAGASTIQQPKPSCVQQVQRANMLLGDLGETLRLAAAGSLSQARMRLLHAIGFMLASPVETSQEAFDFFAHAQVEDKYDGIRAQVHVVGGEVRIFSRTLDEISDSFPDLIDPLLGFADDVILDGEILAWDFNDSQSSSVATHNRHPERSEGSTHFAAPTRSIGRALPFSALQKRLGRKRPSARIQREVPVAYVIFDLLYTANELVIDRPLRERAVLLDALFANSAGRAAPARKRRVAVEDAQGALQFEPVIFGVETGLCPVQEESKTRPHTEPGAINHRPPSAVIRAPVLRADSSWHLSEMFELAQARGNEGLMIKDLESPYTPGRRGKSWLKLKRELATLDVVVTAVERGNGKRAGVLSDYTFAVRDENGSLLNIGKAYSGLTDAEIAEMTEWFERHTIEDSGWMRQVEPKIVIEVAFNAVMHSDRHNSGFALRFPRILRLRPDKSPAEADTIERVREIYERQHVLPNTA